ncbi:DNA-directed RNA polymerase subunit beta' [Pseudothermotoga thermarum]|uniref:DNA-directed RNA polymerase subunit beta' n=1 Tax=Pseudothermotoga thermarum DSM 5069 TaxID=688269 RepID=F7YYC5_9THEM|nr:DNA-directed RNA polymerase subunit beta' [Pseudothermotoga thermarum]AEH50946.1 DNA-directed RNA polymerase subunit beta' [Pseudothermotoga thermarum DSM 5069]
MAISTFKRKIAAVKIGVASPDVIRSWSSGEVKKPETINYRSFKPERDGLFCEKIFGPTKDYECACGKYKGKKYEGTVCERCGVRVESKEARRRRMGHIELAAPVVHIWYLKSSPSIIATLLNMNIRDLENITYYGSKRIIEKFYLVTDPKKTNFSKGDVLYQSEYEIYSRALDFEVERAVKIKNPKAPLVSDIDGEVKIKVEKTHTGREITWIYVRRLHKTPIQLQPGMILLVKNNQQVRKGQLLVSEKQIPAFYAPFDGTVEIDELASALTLKPLTTSKEQPITVTIPYCVRVMAKNGAKVKAGEQLLSAGQIQPIECPEDGTVVFGKDLNVKPLEDGTYEVLSAGQIFVESLIEERAYPVFEGAFIQVNDGDTVKAGDYLAERFLFEDEILTMTEYKIFEQHYPGQFSIEVEEENDKAIVAITEIDEELSKLTGLQVGSIITENEYEAYKELYPGKIEAHYGAAAIKKLLEKIDLEKLKAQIEAELASTPRSSGRALKLLRRLKIVKDLIKSGTRPEWMVLEVLPVIPPDLRPMIQIDGGRFATTDLNDLYRRVINRNNRLRRFLEIGAPEIIVRNEKRMLQEAVDSLLYNGRIGKPVTDRNGRPLKSLTDLVKGKKGRFRRNLLGKRVDYSGRAVIVVGPNLKIHQCGLPKKMAMELFKPFVYAKLLEGGIDSSKSRKMKRRIIEKEMPEAWDVLEEVIKGQLVLLNRAPTLHRMSIQAFEPKLIEGNAIQLHPLVCPPFNADFDGDQMAVHLPLSAAAQAEARYLMLSRYNIISPAHGKPISMPGKDIIVGLYYLTAVGKDFEKVQPKFKFSCPEEAILAYSLGYVGLHEPVLAKVKIGDEEKIVKTTVGRIIMNEVIPPDLRDYSATFDKKVIKNVIYDTFKKHGVEMTADLLDAMKDLGFHYATLSGLTMSLKDLVISPLKDKIIEEAKKKVDYIERQYQEGFLTYEERYQEIIKVWSKATEQVQKITYEALGEDPFNPVFMMVNSGARGNIDQVKQLAGMRGLMADPAGRTIEIPIISNFRQGLSSMEFFISTHGARKGAADTALRTSQAGYLTRRLVDVAQAVVVSTTDCGTEDGLKAMELVSIDNLTVQKLKDFLFGRVLAKDVVNPLTGEIVKNPKTGKEYVRNTMLSDEDAEFLADYSLVVPVCEEKILDLHSLQLPHAYAEIAEDIFAPDGTHFEAGTELTWEVIRVARNAGKKELKVKVYPVVGTVCLETVYDSKKSKQLTVYQEEIDEVIAKVLEENNVTQLRVRPNIYVRSPLTCTAEKGVCAMCYGMDLSSHKIVNVGEAVGIIAAQSIGEPGTQLTMRTFHTGGIATAADITQGLPRAEELFEARKKLRDPEAAFSLVTGIVKDIKEVDGKKKIYVEDFSGQIHEYEVPEKTKERVKPGDKVLPGTQLTTGSIRLRKLMDTLGVEATAMYLLRETQKVYVEQGVEIHDKHFEIIIRQMLGKVEVIYPGDTDYLPGQLLPLIEVEKINKAIIEANAEVQNNRKLVIGKTLAKKIVAKVGDSIEEIAPEGAEVTEEILEKAINFGVKEISVYEKGRVETYQILPKEPIQYRRRVLRITKASLEQKGWLSAASFQQTPQVLTEAAIEGRIDYLEGLKENVIVGQLIPAGTGLEIFANIQIEETPRAAEAEKLA